MKETGGFEKDYLLFFGFFGLLLLAFFVSGFDGFFECFAPLLEVVFSVHCLQAALPLDCTCRSNVNGRESRLKL